MPAYVATHSLRFDIALGPSSASYGWLSGTVTDNGNDLWVASETLDDGVTNLAFGTASYVGTVNVNGKDYPVIEDAIDGDYVILFDNVTDFNAAEVQFPTVGDLTPAIVTGSFTACFLTGTGIATASGDVPVESLSIGDMVLNEAGVEVGVKWIGRQTIATMFKPAERVTPVRFAAGSLGNGLPHCDLTVTADHGMLVAGVICHAGALVNGTTITRVPLEEMGDKYTVYHVETEAHEIILANGAPAETFIDNTGRQVFDNFAEFEALYGDVPEMDELPYPRAMSVRQVPAHIAQMLGASKVA